MAGTWAATAVLLLSAVSCHSTKITDIWVAKPVYTGTFERLMIVGLLPTASLRGEYENDFVDKLTTAGALAIASINVVPDVTDIDRKVVEGWIEKFNLDGVVVTHVTDFKHETEYIPPTYSLGGWYGRWQVETAPGVVLEDTKVSLATDLFDAKDEKLIYSAVSKTYDPSSREKAVHAVIDELVADMTKRGFLPAR